MTNKNQRDKSLVFAFLPSHEDYFLNTETHEVKLEKNMPENFNPWKSNWVKVPKLNEHELHDLLLLYLKEVGKKYNESRKQTEANFSIEEREKWRELQIKWAKERALTWVKQFE
ncbi:MAG: hypothetical protein WDZ36_05015 [Balneolaceae bacterium]